MPNFNGSTFCLVIQNAVEFVIIILRSYLRRYKMGSKIHQTEKDIKHCLFLKYLIIIKN